MIETTMNVKKLNERAVLPTRGSKYAAGYDLYANIVWDSEVSPANITIPAGKTEMISTGLAMEIPEGYAGLVFARSGLASKRGLRPANCVGVIDSDYRGEVKVALHNDSNNDETIFADDREDCAFVLWIGNKRLIKRKQFDEYIARQYSI